MSISVNRTDENYVANEKEMFATIWALESLRNYLYSRAKVLIYIDLQPYTPTLINKNIKVKLKHWEAILEEYNYELHYKSERNNVAADWLIRVHWELTLNCRSHV